MDDKNQAARNCKAFLDMIAYSEGTSTIAGSDNGYNVIVGETLFQGYKDHPRILVHLPGLGINSTAAGRYQLLSRYWDAYKKQLNLADFSPKNQDLVALQQIKEQKALNDVLSGNFSEAVRKVSNIWASLPGAGYGQRENKMDELAKVYLAAGGKMKEVVA